MLGERLKESDILWVAIYYIRKGIRQGIGQGGVSDRVRDIDIDRTWVK